MTGPTRILFVCIHNSARSQMAEAFANAYGPPAFLAESAGIEPGRLNPVVVEAMRERGIDISANRTKDVFEFLRQGRSYDFVITVCDETSGERCPLFPGRTERLHWNFADPSSFAGTAEEKLARTREVRDAVERKIRAFLAERTPAGSPHS